MSNETSIALQDEGETQKPKEKTKKLFQDNHLCAMSSRETCVLPSRRTVFPLSSRVAPVLDHLEVLSEKGEPVMLRIRVTAPFKK